MYQTEVIANRSTSEKTFVLSIKKPEAFVFNPGQFVVLEVRIDDVPCRRSYSIASAPHQEEIEIAIRKQELGKVSPYLCNLQPGDTIGLLGPYGNFCVSPDVKSVVCIAAGSGIAPFRSYVLHAQEHRIDQQLHVICSNRLPGDEFFPNEWDSIAPIQYTRMITDESSDECTGRIDAAILSDLVQPDVHFYLCGSTHFVMAMQNMLLDLNVSKDNIHTEKYGKVQS